MTKEGQLARGKANYEAGKFLKNMETLLYIKTLKEDKPKEEKDASSNRRNAKSK